MSAQRKSFFEMGVHSRLDDEEEPVDYECVLFLLTWTAGEFEFVSCSVEGDDRVNVPTQQIISDAKKLMDDMAAINESTD